MLLALRINVLAKGHSGISLETLHAMIQAFNGKPPLQSTADNLVQGSVMKKMTVTSPIITLPHFASAASCLSFVPEKGTVGASGDLAPLSHLALGLMGEGKMWSPKSGWADAKYVRRYRQLQ